MNSNDIATNPNVRELYQKWKTLPMTEMVINMVRLEGRIFMPRPEFIRSEIALAAMGENAGYHSALDRIMNLDQIEKPQDEELKATYGADAIMNEQYPGQKPETKGATHA